MCDDPRMPDPTWPNTGPPGTAIVNDDVISADEAMVSVFDRGFLWGDGVYEVIPCFNGKLFRLADHLERLQASLSYVAIDLTVSTEELSTRTEQLMLLNSDLISAHPICRVGHWVSRGFEDWAPIYERDQSPTFVSFISPVLRPLGRAVYVDGLEMTVVANRRSSPGVVDPRAKITSKMNLIVADIQASSTRRLPLMLDERGFIAESSTSNIFFVKAGKLLTSRPEWVLGGITRKAIIEIAPMLDLEVWEKDLSLIDLADADEIFLTSSTWGVVPVRAIDHMRPKGGPRRPVTTALMDELARLTGFDPLT